MTEARTASRTAAAPMIAYEDAGGAVAWLEHAFGFRENRAARYEDDAGSSGMPRWRRHSAA